MSKSESNPEYESEIRKLVREKVISEKTAQIHLGSFREVLPQAPKEELKLASFQESDSKIRFPPLMALATLIFCSGVVLFIII